MSARQYEDILAPRRAEHSTFMWAAREIDPQIAFKQESKSSPQYHKDEVLKSAKIQELLIALSQQQNIAKEALELQVRNILDEIGYNKKLKVIRWLAIVLVKICSKICTGIYVNEDRIAKLKSMMGGCPVIFVPSHRSYADFILMSLMCFSEELAIPAIAAGMDFHGMWGMGTMLRDTGAFFMRRSYNDDSLYWTTFKQYIYQIVTRGELPIEFFIEGTRSRSNKSLSPKYGLILMILKAFFLAQVPDILFVPINISYDRVLEERLFAFELLGIPKPKESTMGFFKSLSVVKEKYGSVYFNFAEPISAKQFFGPSLDRSVHNLQPIHQQEITESEKRIIPTLAHEIVYQQQKHCTITTFNLMAIVLYNNIIDRGDLMTLNEVVKEITWLKSVTERLGGFVHMNNSHDNVKEALQVHKNIVQLNDEGKLTLVWSTITLDKLNTNKLKAHALSEKTISFSVPLLMLQNYINPVLHYFVDVAVLVLILKHLETVTFDQLYKSFCFLRSLLSQEFVTFNSRRQMEFDAALRHCEDLNLIMSTPEGEYKPGVNKKLELVLCNSIDNFIFTYFMVCSVLHQVSTRIIDEKSVLAKVQETVQRKLDDGREFIHPNCLNLDTISNCLNTLASDRAIVKSREKNTVMYEIDGSAVLSIKNEVKRFMRPIKVTERAEILQLQLKTKL